MDKLSLVALLDEDREMVLANLNRDRGLAAAQAALEKEIDRMLYRYVELCESGAQREAAQHILQAMKNTLPVMDAVGEARVWKKQYEPAGRGKPSFTTASLAMLAVGLVLVLASVLGVLIAGRGGVMAFIKALLPVVLGCGLLIWGGMKAAAPKADKPRDDGEAPVRTEYLADAEKAWHCLRGAMLQADGQLERIREESAGQRAGSAQAVAQGPVDAGTLELFSELLELAYASKEDAARESAAAIRFYLHGAGVDVTDYAPGKESWFEFLPASGAGTIRPALTAEGKVLKKGLASARR